jgi:hypothetical protein
MHLKCFQEVANRHHQLYASTLAEDQVCQDPLLAVDTILGNPKGKQISEFFSQIDQTKKPYFDKPILTSIQKKKTSQDSKSTPMSPLNLSHESGSQISENKQQTGLQPKTKKTPSMNLTAEPQDDCQVINLSDSDSNLDRDIPKLNSFFNDVQTTDDFVSYVSHFEGGRKR